MDKNDVIHLYNQSNSIKDCAYKLSISEQKVRRILLTAGVYTTDLIDCIAVLRQKGMTIDEISKSLGITCNTVISNSPYTKGMYDRDDPTANALRIKKFRNKVQKKPGGYP